MRSRRHPIALLVLILALALAACGGAAPPAGQAPDATAPAAATSAPAASAATEAPAAAGSGTLNGVTLPPDAAPAEQQVFISYYDNTADFTTVDFYESVYKRADARTDLLSDPLVRINKNFEIVPAAATAWEVDASGLVWTFTLDPNLIWSDDTPVTANDYVATLRYGADPEHAWDFTWFFNGIIAGWDEVVAGTKPLEELGVVAVDDHTLQITTQAPAPYLPAMMLYSNPLQQQALEAHGGLYNSDPATSVSSGPFVLVEWSKGERLVYEANPKYRGTNKPYIQKIINIGAAPATMFAGYQAGEVDFVNGQYLSPADNEIIASDPALQAESRPHQGDFRTDYLFFDTQNPPFNDLKVRQAFSHVVDRDGLIQSIIKGSQGIPAYSFLMPGFPAANSEGLSEIQRYDPTVAKQLLAEAGYPDGAGFPDVTLWLRNEPPVRQAVAQAIAASIKQNLGIEVAVSNKEFKTFTDALNAKPTEIQFGMVSYGFDFLDPSNMLSVWLGGGRHNWNNTSFDTMVKEAAAFTGDGAERVAMFQAAERLLVEEVPAVFIYHRTVSDIYKPYLKGSELEPDNSGFAAIHWPGYTNGSTIVGSMYVSQEVASANRRIP
jgi:ABC-type oligopeptide transport system substrate-binding subunit